MANKKIMKPKSITTLHKLGKEINNILTCFFIDGIELMLLRGLIDLKALKA